MRRNDDTEVESCLRCNIKYSLVFMLCLSLLQTSNSESKIDAGINSKGCGESEPTGRVFNGKTISKPQIPWIVQLISPIPGTQNMETCGGSIITSNVVLTAAHCLKEKPIKEVQIYYNSTKLMDGPINYGDRFFVHPNYNKKTAIKYDIALLKAKKEFKFDKFVRPICIPEKDIEIGQSSLLAGGWGIIDDREPPTQSKILLYTILRVMSEEKCKKILKDFTAKGIGGVDGDLMLCLEGPNGTICPGDSGGPITMRSKTGNSVQVGVHSLGATCGDSNPHSLPIRVSKFLSWIKDALSNPQRWQVLKGGNR